MVDWPLAEALACYEGIVRREALAAFRHRELVWCLIAPHLARADRPPYPRPPLHLFDLDG